MRTKNRPPSPPPQPKNPPPRRSPRPRRRGRGKPRPARGTPTIWGMRTSPSPRAAIVPPAPISLRQVLPPKGPNYTALPKNPPVAHNLESCPKTYSGHFGRGQPVVRQFEIQNPGGLRFLLAWAIQNRIRAIAPSPGTMTHPSAACRQSNGPPAIKQNSIISTALPNRTDLPHRYRGCPSGFAIEASSAT